MEKDKRLMAIVSAVVVVLFAFSYAVGYFVGKRSGIKEERAKCEMEKKQIVKTLARIAPVSRPQPQIEEEVVGGEPHPQTEEVKGQNRPEQTEEAATGENAIKESQEEKAPAPQTPSEATVEAKVEEKKGQENSPSNPQPVKVVSKESSKPKRVAKKKTRKGEKLYFLQVGVFKSKKNAVKLANKLKAKGFDAKTEFFRGYARVIVGYFKSWQEANAVRKELLNSGYKSLIRWRKS